MRAFVILSPLLLFSVVYADVSHLAGQQYSQQGYQYNQPKVQYQPQYPVTASDAASSSYNGVANSYVPPASGAVGPYSRPPGAYSQERSQTYLIPPPSQAVQGQNTNYQQQYAQTNLNTHTSGSAVTSYGASNSLNAHSTAQSTGQYYAQQPYQQQQQQQVRQQQIQPIVTKHFYVHAAPEDPEERVEPQYVTIGRPQKNYKVIFIKAPTYRTSSQIIPILPKNEEKTIVYVLSKKPSYHPTIEIPEQPVTEPSKPDVFFIKYKTAAEAQAAQEKIQAAYETGQLGASDTPTNQNLLSQIFSGSGVVQSVQSTGNTAATNVGNLVQNVSGGVQQAINTGIQNAQNVATGIQGFGSGVVSNIQSGASSIGAQIPRQNDAGNTQNSAVSAHQTYLSPNSH